jgi:peptide/nickel transport system substrate-binding protein
MIWRNVDVPSGRRSIGAGCAIVVALLACATCTRSTRPDSLVIQWSAVPLTLDPHAHNDNATWALLGNFYDGLVQFTPEMRVEPALARSWQQVDATHWRFELRGGVSFHSGHPLRAADVVASFERARRSPDTAMRHHLIGIESVRSAGAEAVLVETAGPAPTLLNRLVYLFILREADAGPELPVLPNGTGPYRVVEARPGDSLRAVAVAGWHGDPDFRNVVFRFGESAGGAGNAIATGLAHLVRALPDDEVRKLRGNPNVRLVIQPRLTVRLLSVCASAATGDAAAALADVRVRRAMLLALDRERWIREVYSEAGVVTSQYVQPVVFGYDPGVPPVAYNLGEARRLMLDAGYPTGFEVDLAHSAIQRDRVPALVRDLERLGIRAHRVELPWDKLLERARSGQSPLTFWGWACATGDASDFLDACVHGIEAERGYGSENYSRYRNPATDALIEAASHELDPVRRLDLLQRAQRSVLADLPVIPLAMTWDHLAVTPEIELTPRHDGWLRVAGCRWIR